MLKFDDNYKLFIMKKTLLFLSVIFTYTFSNAQILTENFEGATFPPSGWTVVNTNGSGYNWMSVLNGFTPAGQGTFLISGNDSAAVPWIDENQDESLVSPSFSLVGYSTANLTFNAKIGYEFMVDPFNAGDLMIGISTNGGTSWTQLWVEEDYGTFTDYATLAINLDLGAYLSFSNVKIRFQYVGNDADTVSIDDILIAGTLSNPDFADNSLSIYPNPVSNVLNISNLNNFEIKGITVIDVNGRVIKNQQGSLTQINVSDLNTGVYFVTIEAAEGKTTKKFIKQ